MLSDLKDFSPPCLRFALPSTRPLSPTDAPIPRHPASHPHSQRVSISFLLTLQPGPKVTTGSPCRAHLAHRCVLPGLHNVFNIFKLMVNIQPLICGHQKTQFLVSEKACAPSYVNQMRSRLYHPFRQICAPLLECAPQFTSLPHQSVSILLLRKSCFSERRKIVLCLLKGENKR